MAEDQDLVQPLLEAASSADTLELVLSLLEADNEEDWLKERITDALRD
jgi:hypothetical protein